MLPTKKHPSSRPLRLLLLVVALAVVIVLLSVFGVIGPSNDKTADEAALSAKYNTYDAVKNPNKRFTLVFNAETHQLTSGPSKIQLTEGDVVDIHVLSTGDEADEAQVNLEGYDVTTEAGSNEDTSGDLMFVAYKPGTFRISDLGDEVSYPAGQYVIATVEVAKK